MDNPPFKLDEKHVLELILGRREKRLVREKVYEKRFEILKKEYPFNYDRMKPLLGEWCEENSPQALLLTNPDLSLTDTQEHYLVDQLCVGLKQSIDDSFEEVNRMMTFPYLGASWRMLASFPHHMALRAHLLTQGFDPSFLQDYTSGHCTGEASARLYLSLARKDVEKALIEDASNGIFSLLEVDKNSRYYRALSECNQRLK